MERESLCPSLDALLGGYAHCTSSLNDPKALVTGLIQNGTVGCWDEQLGAAFHGITQSG